MNTNLGIIELKGKKVPQSSIHVLNHFFSEFLNKVGHLEDINTVNDAKTKIRVEKNIPH